MSGIREKTVPDRRRNCEYPACENKSVSKVRIAGPVETCKACGSQTAQYTDEYRCEDHGGVK
jgi:hypothetical protein